MTSEEKQTSKLSLKSVKHSTWLNVFMVVVGLAAAAFFGASLFRDTLAAQNSESPQNGSVKPDNNSDNMATLISEGIVLGESDVSLPGSLKSENYTLGRVALGGDIATESLEGAEDVGTLEISAVRGESYMEKGKKEVNVLVTWKTTKLSSGTIRYGKNGADAFNAIEEDGYGLNHSIILSGLDQASTYVYSITAEDRSGNEVSTDSYAVYTGTKSASLYDLISGAVGDTFGWAIKK